MIRWRNAKIVNEVSTQVLKQYRYALDRQGPDQKRSTIRVPSTERAPEPVQITGLEQEEVPSSWRQRRTMADRHHPVEIDLSQPCMPVARPSMLRMAVSAVPISHAARRRKRGHAAATTAQMDDLNSHVVDTTDAPILDDAPTVGG
ncbi:hypothetical protein GH714_013256 [Hevea brasiliensis]|uniref:Uncharacterized protein n=1 Tax=Hevea brasiliensis TaxID=3981 RepID=A0A6A6KN98_HEVBR|nr:hypothetical protein GH714_013256 [Hevea brasiliensis]